MQNYSKLTEQKVFVLISPSSVECRYCYRSKFPKIRLGKEMVILNVSEQN